MEIKILPYCELDGVWTVRDSHIKKIYDRMEKEGTAKISFPDGSVNNRNEFLTEMKHGPSLLEFVHEKNSAELLAIIWLNGICGKRAYIHFCGFKLAWGRESIDIGKAAVYELLNRKYKSDGSYVFDCFIGVTPKSNRLAVKYIDRLGGDIMGEIPNACWNEEKQASETGILSYYTRKEQGK